MAAGAAFGLVFAPLSYALPPESLPVEPPDELEHVDLPDTLERQGAGEPVDPVAQRDALGHAAKGEGRPPLGDHRKGVPGQKIVDLLGLRGGGEIEVLEIQAHALSNLSALEPKW